MPNITECTSNRKLQQEAFDFNKSNDAISVYKDGASNGLDFMKGIIKELAVKSELLRSILIS